ncbi:MAG: hypothetical protein MZU97_20200 [Bacillus subtilis]|nr:hypothetical protein [Bacillus subtilis]
MKSRHQGLLLTSLLMTAYLLLATPYYLLEGEKLANAVVAAAIYYALVQTHLVICGIAVGFQWLGFATRKRGFPRLASWLLLIGGLFFLPSYLAIIPLIILNRVFRVPKPSIQPLL